MKPATEIQSNNNTYYFSFGIAALSRFCEVEGLNLNDLGQLAEGMTPLRALNMIYAGLKDGYRREGVPFNLTLDDVGDIVDDDPEFMAKCMDVVTKSMPTGNEQAGSKKKATR